MKLSKTQQEVLDKAKRTIDFARTHTMLEWALKSKFGVVTIEECWWVVNHDDHGMTKEQARKEVKEEAHKYADGYGKYYLEERNGIVLTHCNSKTLEALEKRGLIEIIYDSKNGGSIDTIKVLDY